VEEGARTGLGLGQQAILISRSSLLLASKWLSGQADHLPLRRLVGAEKIQKVDLSSSRLSPLGRGELLRARSGEVAGCTPLTKPMHSANNGNSNA